MGHLLVLASARAVLVYLLRGAELVHARGVLVPPSEQDASLAVCPSAGRQRSFVDVAGGRAWFGGARTASEQVTVPPIRVRCWTGFGPQVPNRRQRVGQRPYGGKGRGCGRYGERGRERRIGPRAVVDRGRVQKGAAARAALCRVKASFFRRR